MMLILEIWNIHTNFEAGDTGQLFCPGAVTVTVKPGAAIERAPRYSTA